MTYYETKTITTVIKLVSDSIKQIYLSISIILLIYKNNKYSMNKIRFEIKQFCHTYCQL